MPCGTVVQDGALEFGVAADEASLVTQSVSVTNKIDKKEARDKCGIIVAVAYYNPTSEIQIEGLGTAATTVGSALSLTGTYLGLAGATYVDEVSLEKANEEFVKSTIRATSYGGITGS
jgi:predicted alternative tryptophan synthase beta-subunit